MTLETNVKQQQEEHQYQKNNRLESIFPRQHCIDNQYALGSEINKKGLGNC